MIALLPLLARPLLLVHVMPWFAAPPVSPEWGWHWTMGNTDAAKGHLASHYHPLIGAYDSGDPDAIECQTLLMKLAGFDGMLVDWYGDRERYDYLFNDRNTDRLFAASRLAGLKFGLVYEDQTVPNLIAGKVFSKEQATEEGKALLERTQKRWMGAPNYIRLTERPLFAVFGPQYYPEDDWEKLLSGLAPKPIFLTLHHRRGPADGAYDWPLPQGGTEKALAAQDAFAARAKDWPVSMGVAFPRFHDFYKAAGVSPGFDEVEDRSGQTYETTLRKSLTAGYPMIQVATWNDWGEGTQIEPSKEFGYRDLETTQRLRKQFFDAKFAFTPKDLRLPVRLYALRKRGADKGKLDSIAAALRSGKTAGVADRLTALEKVGPPSPPLRP